MLCQICFQPKRKPRFASARIRVCQWCITELCNTELPPHQILKVKEFNFQKSRRDALQHEIRGLELSLSSAPTLDQTRLTQAELLALHEVKQAENVFTSIYRSVFDDNKRQTEANRISNIRKNTIIADHKQIVADHAIRQRQVRSRISDLEAAMVNVSTESDKDLEQYFQDLLIERPTKSKEDRIIRAHEIGLINFEREKLERPDEQSYEAIKREIRKQDENRCVCCSRGFDRGELHVHHIIPLYQFGTNEFKNLVTLCHPCHNKQHDFKVSRNYPIRRAPRQQIFVAVDIETTGFSNEDSIIEIGAALFVNGEVKDTFHSLVHTKRELPYAITRLTGITPELLQDAPLADVAFHDFRTFIADYRLVFHNSSFDMRFLNRYADHFKVSIPNSVHDTLRMAREKLPELQNHKLGTLINHFQIAANPTHRAKDDSIATGFLYIQLSTIGSLKRKSRVRVNASPSTN